MLKLLVAAIMQSLQSHVRTPRGHLDLALAATGKYVKYVHGPSVKRTVKCSTFTILLPA